MKSIFTKFSVRTIGATLAIVTLAGFTAYNVFATSTVTPATGGSTISIDKTTATGGSSSWTTLTGFVISESALGDIGLGLHTITLPTGWEFKTDEAVIISGNSTDIDLNFSSITPGSNTLSFNVRGVSSSSPAVLTFSNIKVRPTGTVPGSVNMTMTSGTIAGVDGTTNFGTLTSVPGAPTKLAFTTQPTDTVYGSNIATVVVKTQDQFGNNSVPTSGVNNVSLLLTGTGVLSGATPIDIGTSGTASFSILTISDVGTGKTLTASAAGLTSAISSTFNINQKALTATITASNKVYDGNTTASITGRSLTGVVSGDTVGVTGGTATFADANVATGIVVSATGMTLTGADLAKYSFDGTGSGTANITKKTVTVTPTSGLTKIYGGSDPTLTYTEDVALISGNTFTGALARTAGESVNTYAINVGNLSAGSNYDVVLAVAPVTFEITQKAITVTASANSKEYDGTTSASAIPVVTGGLAFADSANFTEAYSTATVGTGNKTLVPSGTVTSVNSGTNYAITFTNYTTGTITAKELTVTGLSLSDKVYDGNTTASITGTPALSGVIAGDVADVLISGTAGGSFTTPTVGAKTITVTGLSLTGSASGNYTLTAPVVSGNITKKTVTVTPTSGLTKIYGGSDPTLTYTEDVALISGNSFTGALSRTTGESVNTYAINAGNLSAGSNYDVVLAVAPVTFEITQKAITVTASANSKEYDGTTSASAIPVVTGGLAFADSANFTEAYSTATVGTGNKTLVPSGTVTSVNSGTNYAITFTNYTTGTITAKELTVTGLSLSDKVYDGNTTASITGTPALSGVIAGDVADVLISGTAGGSFTTPTVGAKTITVTGLSLTGSASGNYTLTAPVVSGNITKKTVTVTPTSGLTKIYGGSDPTLTYTEDVALISGNTFTGALARTAGESVNTYAINVGNLSAGSNYDVVLAVAPVTFAITQAPLTITADNKTKVYGATNPALTVSYSGLVNGDSAPATPATANRVAGETVAGSPYVITPSGAVDGNYSISYVNGSFTITQAPLTITADNKTKVYGATNPALTVSYSGLVNGDSAPATPATANRVAGETVAGSPYVITPSGAVDGNYAISYTNGSFTITQAPLTITAANKSKEFGTTDPALTYTLSALANGDTSAVVTGSLTRTTGETVAGSPYAITQGTVVATGNYNVTYVAGVFSIVDTTPPVIAAHSDVNAVADQLGGASITSAYTAPTATDAADPSFSKPAICSPVSGSVFLMGTTTVTCNISDVSGNAAIATTFKVVVVPAPISQIELAASPTSLDISSPSTLTVTGKDQYGNIVTNNSTTPVILSVDNGALATTRLTLTSGVKATTLSRSSAGASIVNAFTVLSGSLASAEVTVTFTDGSDRTAPVISSITTNKASYEATNDANITVTVVEDNTANTVTVNGFAAVETATPGTWTVTFVKSTTIGTQSLTVSATDASLNVRTSNSSYNVVANSVSAVTPTVAINGAAILPVYTATAAAARFASGLQFNATNTASVTVNGVTKTPGSLITADTVASSTTLGVHTYDVIVTSSTGHTANVLVSYQVNADAVTPVIPTVTLTGAAAVSAYSASAANTRFTSGVQFTTANAASVTVNGVSVTPGTTITADTNAGAKTLGAHSYDVIVTSTTGHTANILVTYQVNADAVTPIIPTVAIKTGDAAIVSAYSASAANTRFTSGVQFTVTNDSTVTVNGTTVASVSGVVTADTNAGAKTLGAHAYNVIVTSSTGHTANMTIAYQVNADSVTPVTPTVAINGAAILPVYSATAAAARFASGLQFNATNTASVTVNGVTKTPGSLITADSVASSTTLGVHTYDVIVTSSTGHTANILVSYQVNADAVTPVTPTVTLSGVAVLTTYTVSEANTRFPSGVQLTTTNAATTTVNGVVVTSAGTLTVANNAAAKTLGAHVYNVIVTSTTGHTANITVAYEVTADPVVQGNGTLGVTGITASSSFATADGTFTNGWSWVFYVTVPTTETSLQMKFADWVSGSNSIAAANNIRIYSPQSLTASTTSTAKTVTAANTYTSAMTLTSDLDANTEGRQVRVIVEAAVPVGSLAGSYSTSYGTKSQ